MAKTNWQMGDTVQPSDMNDIGQEINEAKADAQTAQATADNHSSRHAVGGEDPLTPAQIGAETPAGAQAKADAAEQAAKAYADQKVADIPSPPVTSVNAKTGAVVLAKGDVGLGNVDNLKQATKTEFDAHLANKNNPHGVTKAQIGLGSVQNYGIASQAQAQAGTANNVYMTPLRTKEAITAQTGGVLWRINNGQPEYNDGTEWKPVGGIMYASNTIRHEFLTQRSGNQSQSVLVAKFIPPGPGEFILEYEAMTVAAQTPTLALCYSMTSTVSTSNFDYRTPLGTLITSIGNTQEITVSLAGLNEWEKKEHNIIYQRVGPLYLFIRRGEYTRLRNVRIRYDLG